MGLLFGAWSAVSFANDAYLDGLIDAARDRGLAQDPEWHALLHYRPNRLFPGITSEADHPQFFISPTGKTDPQAELEATLAAFFSDVQETDTQQHPQCAFVARYHWLKRRLGFDAQRLPERECRRYQAWRSTLNPGKVTLVFPAAYVNNPSSMFGHTLLRVDAKDQAERADLLAYAVNYAAQTDEQNGAVFAVRAMIGSYPGAFTMTPYYVKVKEYSDIEHRDLWEYELTFTPEEIDRMLMHVWELGPIHFDYYFFDENCSYHLLSLFEIARPGLTLSHQFHGWVIPSDTVRAVADQPGLVAKVTYRPAASAQLRQRLQEMSGEEQRLAKAVSEGRLGIDAPELQSRPPGSRARVLEAAYEHVRYEYTKGRREQAGSAKLSHELLLARSRIAAASQMPALSVPPRPDQGHETIRAALALGSEDDRRFEELKLRPAYHDLLDRDDGYSAGAQINFFDVTLRRYRDNNHLRLEELSLIDIVSLAPRDAFFRPLSWKVGTGLRRQRLRDDDTALAYTLNGGAGWAKAPVRNLLVYGFLDAGLDASRHLDAGYDLGAGASAGIFWRPRPNWKVHAWARSLTYFLGDEHKLQQVAIEQSYALTANNALRLSAAAEREFDTHWTTLKLSWHAYFF